MCFGHAPVPHVAQMRLHGADLALGHGLQDLQDARHVYLRDAQRKGAHVENALKHHLDLFRAQREGGISNGCSMLPTIRNNITGPALRRGSLL